MPQAMRHHRKRSHTDAHAAVCQVQLETERKWRQIQVLPSLRRWIDLRPAVKRRYGRSACIVDIQLYRVMTFKFALLWQQHNSDVR